MITDTLPHAAPTDSSNPPRGCSSRAGEEAAIMDNRLAESATVAQARTGEELYRRFGLHRKTLRNREENVMHARHLFISSITLLLVMVAVSSFIASVAYADSRFYGRGVWAENGIPDTYDNILGQRDFKTISAIIPRSYQGQGNLSTWVMIDKWWVDPYLGANGCTDHVEVAYIVRCERTGGCTEQLPTRTWALYESGWYTELNNGVASQRCWKMWTKGPKSNSIALGTVVDFVLIATDDTGEYWWGGISGPSPGVESLGWYLSGNFKMRHNDNTTGNDGGHSIKTGAEYVPTVSGIDIDLSHITGIEYTESLGGGWGAWPDGDSNMGGDLFWYWKDIPTHGCVGTDTTEVANC